MGKLNSVCTVCGAGLNLPKDLEVSEIINCRGCQTRLVVEKIESGKVILDQAPKVEEDWGE